MSDRCGLCGKRCEGLPISRYGGGNYRRAGRFYRGHICLPCATRLVEKTKDRSGSESVERYSIGTLRRLVGPSV